MPVPGVIVMDGMPEVGTPLPGEAGEEPPLCMAATAPPAAAAPPIARITEAFCSRHDRE